MLANVIRLAPRWSLIGVVGLFLVGCGGSSNLPKGETGTVSGKVTFEGKPVPAGCQVIFVGDKSGILGTGIVGADSTYTLSMRGDNKILVGKYRVAVSPPKPHPELSDDEIAKLAMEKKLPPTPEVKEVPQKYRSPETTPVNFDVKAEANTADIDMKSM